MTQKVKPIDKAEKNPNLILILLAFTRLLSYYFISYSSPFKLFTVFIAVRAYSALPPASRYILYTKDVAFYVIQVMRNPQTIIKGKAEVHTKLSSQPLRYPTFIRLLKSDKN